MAISDSTWTANVFERTWLQVQDGPLIKNTLDVKNLACDN